MTIDLVLNFLISLVEDRGLVRSTVLPCKSSLVEPLSRGFGLDMGVNTFNVLSGSMFLKRPGVGYSEPKWCLDLVLDLLSSNRFNINVTLEDLTLKTVFLLGLALGSRASEVHSLLRSPRFL